MHKILLSITLLLFTAFSSYASPISLTIPEAALVQAAKEITPLELRPKGSLQGKVYITKIDNLKLSPGTVSCTLSLAGEGLQVTTKLAGTNINLNIGEVSTTMSSDLELIYNKTNEEIILIPRVQESEESSAKTDVTTLLLRLLDGQKFPIALQDIPPFATGEGSNAFLINMDIVDIAVEQGKIAILLEPTVSKRSPAQD